MSVHRRVLPSGAVTFDVRWREGGRARSKSFAAARLGGERQAERAARAYDRVVAGELLTGGVAPSSVAALTVDDAIAAWLPAAGARLARDTYDSYMSLIRLHIRPSLGDRQLRSLTPADVEDWAAQLARDGVGAPTIRKAGAVLSSIMQRAVKAREIQANPVRDAQMPAARRAREPLFITPVQVERIRAWLVERGHVGDAVMVSLLAYAGLRPESEAWPLEWRNVGDRSIVVMASRKRGARDRVVDMPGPLAEDLRRWRAAGPQGRLVIPASGQHVGGEGMWTAAGWKNWRRRTWAQACQAAGVPDGARPRDLRNGFASLLIYEGRPITEVAAQLGHAPSMTLDTYARVFAEYDRRNMVRASTAIKRARAQVSAGLRLVDSA